MASDSLDTFREVVVRSSQQGKLRVDLALLAREKQQLLAQLGEQIVPLVESGTLAVPDSVRYTCEQVRELDARMKADAGRVHDNAFGAPRGYEPEAGGYGAAEDDVLEETDVDEHAQMAQEKRRR